MGTTDFKKSVDIIIVAYNDLERLKRLVFSIHRNTEDYDYEITIIDNSDENVATEFFQKFKRTRTRYQLENLGWTGGVNHGWKLATREYIVTLNDDAEVSPKWLDSMIRILDSGTAELVVPVCTAGNRGSMAWVKQELKKEYPLFHQYTSYAECAKDVREKFNEQFNLLRVPMSFYCLAMKREKQKEIGFLDEQFNHGGFDDDDYCKRIIDRGENIGIALDTLLYHQVSASGGGYGKAFKNLLTNEKKFNKKWGIPTKTSVLIAVPNMAGISPHLVEFLRVMDKFKSPNYDVEVLDTVYSHGIAPVDRARNVITKKFLAGRHEFLLMIDDDIEPPWNVVDMCLHNKPVIAAVCFGWISNTEGHTGIYPVIFDWNFKEGKYISSKKLNERGIIECDAVGTGCVMIRRDVVETVEPPWFNMTFKEDFNVDVGEDVKFCEEAKEKGFGIFVDKDKVCDHIKKVNLKVVHEQQWRYIVHTREKMHERLEKMLEEREGEIVKRAMKAAQIAVQQGARSSILLPGGRP